MGVWDELFGEAQAGFATQTNLVFSGSRVLRRRVCIYRREFPAGWRFSPLRSPDLLPASPAMVEKVLLVGDLGKTETSRRAIAAEAGHCTGITGDHCRAIAAKALLKGSQSDVKNYQCFHVVDSSRGNILAGVIVPGTGIELLWSLFAEVAPRYGVNYNKYYADNPPTGCAMLEQELRMTKIGTGHLVRRLTATVNSGCLNATEHGGEVGSILRDQDADVAVTIKALVFTPGDR